MSAQPYRILIAPACFKGSLSAPEVAEAIGEFLRMHLPEEVMLDICPIADGGDDTLTILQAHDAGFHAYSAEVTGPVPGMTVSARYLFHASEKRVMIEAAQVHGLKLLPENQLAPMAATSYGVGELIRQAVQTVRPESIVVTVGGSASTDGGLGALQALGAEFLDSNGQPIQTPIGGGMLREIYGIGCMPSEFIPGSLLIATDVENPLLGSNGTASVFAPQKGANTQQCRELEDGLSHIRQLLSKACDMDCATLPGTGAAGGLAYGLRYLPRSGITSGSQWVAEQLGLMARIRQADLIITGEGCFDATSFAGKGTGNLLVWADEKPVMVFCGQMQRSLNGLKQVEVYPLVPAGASAASSLANPKATLRQQLELALPYLKARLP